MKVWAIVGVLAGAFCFAAGEAQAGTIVGGSDLVSSGDLTQLENWLGEGSLTLTNIYDLASGDSASDFHAAADGKGRTFSVYAVRLVGTGEVKVVGGYNPQSWDGALEGMHTTIALADRTAFIFNLTDTTKLDQRTGSFGYYQTYNASAYFPTFGGGYDLFARDAYSGSGYATTYSYSYSYGNGDGGANLFGLTGSTLYRLEGLEVFSIAPQVVPLPPSVLMGLSLLGGLGLLKLLQSRRQAAFV